jgi:hypothetical protein
MKELQCALSLCKIAESMIEVRHPKIMKDPNRFLIFMNSKLVQLFVVRPKVFNKELLAKENKVKNKKERIKTELKNMIEYMSLEKYISLINYRTNIAAVGCPVCRSLIPNSVFEEHIKSCQEKDELNFVIEDADKIILKVCCSATTKISTLMVDQKKLSSKTSNNKDKEEKKDKLINIMYPGARSIIDTQGWNSKRQKTSNKGADRLGSPPLTRLKQTKCYADADSEQVLTNLYHYRNQQETLIL